MSRFLNSFWLGLLGVFVWANVALAATVTNHLSWSVTNTPTVPADQYRVEKDNAGTWETVATVPGTQLTYDDAGLSPALYTYRIVPMANGLDGTPSNSHTCGAVGPDTTLTFTCSPEVVP